MGAYLRLGSQKTINTIGIKLKRECFISYLEEQVGKSRYNCTAKFFEPYIWVAQVSVETLLLVFIV